MRVLKSGFVETRRRGPGDPADAAPAGLRVACDGEAGGGGALGQRQSKALRRWRLQGWGLRSLWSCWKKVSICSCGLARGEALNVWPSWRVMAVKTAATAIPYASSSVG